MHLCLFFISPHQLKRADVDLMRRLHALVPLVVVIAKSEYATARAIEPAAGDNGKLPRGFLAPDPPQRD